MSKKPYCDGKTSIIFLMNFICLSIRNSPCFPDASKVHLESSMIMSLRWTKSYDSMPKWTTIPRSFLTKPSLLYQLVNIAPNLWKAKHAFLSVFILLDTHKYDRHYCRDLEQKIIRYFRKSRWKSRIFKMVAFVGWWPDYFCCCCCGGWTQGSEISFISGKHLERPPHYRPVDTGGAGGAMPQ